MNTTANQESGQVPRAIDVMRYAAAREPEITALLNSLKLTGDFGAQAVRRHLRRRARSHNAYRHTRRPNAKLVELRKQQDQGVQTDTEGVLEVPTNRKMRRRRGRLQAQFAQSAQWDESTLVVDEGSKRRLETHLWHVKRLSMIERWGWLLPEGQLGRGLGSRAFMKRLQKGSVVHDASYWCPFLLTGAAAEELVTVFDMVLSPVDQLELGVLLNSGPKRERQMILHEAGQFPAGCIAPAIVTSLQDGSAEEEAADGGGAQLLVWSHPATANDIFASLSTAIEAAMCESIMIQVVDLRRLEIRGAAADEAVARALFAQNSTAQGPEEADNTTVCLPDEIKNANAADAIQVTLVDPRIARPQPLGSIAASLLTGIQAPQTLQLINSNVPMPAPESRSSDWRKQLREDFVGLTLNMFKKSVPPIPFRDPADAQYGLHCPLLYVKQPWGSDVPGCSLILPAQWVVPIWHALVYAGCKAIGQREWHWLHTLLRMPFFPYDMPDTSAYTELMNSLQQQNQKEAAKRPKGRHTNNINLPLAWESCLEQSNADNQDHDNIFIARQTGAVDSSCFVEVIIQPIKQGHILENAQICYIPGHETRIPKTSWHITKFGLSKLDEANSKDECVDTMPATFGFVTSAAPKGGRRGLASMAVCSLTQFNALCALQHKESQKNKGTVLAYCQNPGSTALFPIKLQLLRRNM